MSRRIVRKLEIQTTVDNRPKFTPPHPDEELEKGITFNLEPGPVCITHKISMQREASFGSLLSDLSENTDRSGSSCSWEEEIDAANSGRLKEVLDAIDDYLYDNKYSSIVGEEIIEDCKIWAKEFPHLRIVGKNPKDCYNYFELYNRTESQSDSVDLCEEEILAQSNARNAKSLLNETDFEDSLENSNDYDISVLKEKVLEELVKQLMPRVQSWQEALNKANKLRPYSAVPRIKRSLRPMTAEENRLFLPPVSPLSQPLQGILTISSKVLQDRKIKSTGSIVPQYRPSSSISGFRENRRNSLYSNSKRPSKITVPKLSPITPDSTYIFQEHNKSILPDISSPTRDFSHNLQFPTFNNNKALRFGIASMIGKHIVAGSRPGTGRFGRDEPIPSINVKSPRSSALVKRAHSRLHFQNPQ